MLHNSHQKSAAVRNGLLSALRLTAVQLLLAGVISALWGLYSFWATESAILGALVSILPSAFFAHRFFASGQQRNPQKIVGAFYRGELLKLLITVALAILIFTTLSVLILPFLSGLVGASFGLWFAPLFMVSRARVMTT